MEIDPINIEFFDPFDEEVCTRCGTCLENCPIMNFSKDEGAKEIRKLIDDKESVVLKKCQSCFTCNFYCPENAHPASLVLNKWNEQYKEEGLRIRGEYYMTLYPHYPNFRSYVMDRLPDKTKRIVKNWASLTPLKGDTLTYPGCNIITFAELTQTKLFDDLDIRGRLEYCCGETLFRTGYRNELFQVTNRLDAWFNTLKPKNLIVLCTAGTNVFKNVLPHYGLTYKFDSIKSYIEYLWEKINNAEISLKKKLDMKVAIQDSCYSKMFGEEYMVLPRKILEYIGIEVVEIDACKEDMRCCGIGGGFSVDSAYNPLNLMRSTFRNIKEFKAKNVDALCVYCAGCLATYMTSMKLYFKRKFKTYHIIELLQMAIGEEPMTQKAKKQRARHFFWGIIKNQLPKTFSKKTFKIAEIPENPADLDTAH